MRRPILLIQDSTNFEETKPEPERAPQYLPLQQQTGIWHDVLPWGAQTNEQIWVSHIYVDRVIELMLFHGWFIFYGTLMVVPYHQITWATQSMSACWQHKNVPNFFWWNWMIFPKWTGEPLLLFVNSWLVENAAIYATNCHRAVVLKTPKLWFHSSLLIAGDHKAQTTSITSSSIQYWDWKKKTVIYGDFYM